MGGRALAFLSLCLVLCGVQQAAAACRLLKVAELPVTMDGFQPTVPVKMNGAAAQMIADSGAFYSVVTPEAAKRLHLRVRAAPSGFFIQGVTGSVTPSIGVADTFGIAEATLKGVEFLVAGEGFEGIDGFLGQNVLGVFETEYDLANGVIRLFHADGCGDAMLAYWAKDVGVSVLPIASMSSTSKDIAGQAQVNGRPIRVILDTGANRSGLKLGAARSLGLSVDAPGAHYAGGVRGIGQRTVDSWIVPVDSFSIGDETIKNTQLRVAREELEGGDMLLGADFFLSHRVLVAPHQRTVYFSYNGGPVFRLDNADASAPAPTSAAPPAATDGLDADSLVRRAKASAVRGELASAIADLTRVIELQPGDPEHFYDRAVLRMRGRQPTLAMGDLDQALKLKPDLVKALLLRGELRLGAGDPSGAEADFQAALTHDPGDLDTGHFIAATYVENGRFEPALAHYDRMLGQHPNDADSPELLNGRCWARALWGRELDKALADCDEALRRQPRNPAFLDSRGLTHLRRGEFDSAISDYSVALKAQPKLPWSLYGRGLAKAKTGDAAGAAADLQAADSLAPELRKKAAKFGITEQTVVALKSP
jgi:tetratricopeptide (TPR) repeat protein/predicted aspartyl protease